MYSASKAHLELSKQVSAHGFTTFVDEFTNNVLHLLLILYREPVLEEHKQVTEVKASDIQNLQEDENVCSNSDGDYKDALRNPEASDVGQALEHVIRLAEDIQEDLAGTAGVRLDTPSSVLPPQATPESRSERCLNVKERDGFLSRLLRSWKMDRYSGAVSEAGKEVPWKDYTRDFQEV